MENRIETFAEEDERVSKDSTRTIVAAIILGYIVACGGVCTAREASSNESATPMTNMAEF